MQPEAKITKKIREFLEEKGAFVFKIHGGPTMLAGLPDLIACYRGMFVGIEVKQPGKKPSLRQVFVHRQIVKAGGTVIVATCVEDVHRVIA
jgi:Holliday junction resolvase